MAEHNTKAGTEVEVIDLVDPSIMQKEVAKLEEAVRSSPVSGEPFVAECLGFLRETADNYKEAVELVSGEVELGG